MQNVCIKHRNEGFTLVELMITVVIAAILMGIVAPGMSKLIERNRLQTTSETVFTSLMLTRSEALKRNREVVMCKSTNGTACVTGTGTNWEQGWLVYVDADNDGSVDADEILRVVGPLGGDITLRTGDFDDEISYNTDGTASGAGEFVMCNAAEDIQTAREIGVTFTGRPKMNKTTTNCTPT
jgi:type IV fimbrial biogenesis protein FimT